MTTDNLNEVHMLTPPQVSYKKNDFISQLRSMSTAA